MPLPRLRPPSTSRRRRLLRSLVVALALVLLLTGCGGTEGESSGGAKGASNSDTADDPAPARNAEPAPDPGFEAAKAGQCFRMTPAQSRASVATSPPVGCRKPHNTVVAFVGYLPKPVTPTTPLAQRRSLGKRLCAPAYRKLVGGTLADRATSILTWTLFTPGQAQLERGARWVRCDVLARSGNGLSPLPAGQPLLRLGVPEQLRVCQNEEGIDVSCSRPHAFRVEAVYRAFGDVYPDLEAYTATARSRCQELTGKPGGFWQPPSRAGWKSGDRFVRCLSPRV
jgi:hypothetical protein